MSWLEAFGEISKVGVEGTGSYGAGIARHLVRAGVHVVEVNRQNRQSRRQSGKLDPLDAAKLPELRSQVGLMVRPREGMARSRPSGSWSWPNAPPGRHG